MNTGVVVADWHPEITDELLRGAMEVLDAPRVVRVPGCWEIPLAVLRLLEDGFGGVVALGCIRRGNTTHADLIASELSRALMDLQVGSGKPVGWGIVTPTTPHESDKGVSEEPYEKGRSAARAVLAMLNP